MNILKKLEFPPTKVRKNIEKVFDDPMVTSEEKIEILEKWRHDLQSEENAFIDGTSLVSKLYAKSPLGDLIKIPTSNNEISNKIESQYFFRIKIDVIKEMLAEELAKARNAHRNTLIQQGKIKKPEAHPEHRVESIPKWIEYASTTPSLNASTIT